MHERKSDSEVAQSCPTHRDPMDCSLPGSPVPGILQARVLEWGAIAFSCQVLEGCKVYKAYFLKVNFETMKFSICILEGIISITVQVTQHKLLLRLVNL